MSLAWEQLTTDEKVALVQYITDIPGVDYAFDRGSDSLDFHDVSVHALRRLAAASYARGRLDAKRAIRLAVTKALDATTCEVRL